MANAKITFSFKTKCKSGKNIQVRERACLGEIGKGGCSGEKEETRICEDCTGTKDTRFLLKKLRGASTTITNIQFKGFPKTVTS